MSGQLVGEVLDAAEAGHLDGLSRFAVHIGSAQHLAATLYAKSWRWQPYSRRLFVTK